jgi:hypothetical protein
LQFARRALKSFCPAQRLSVASKKMVDQKNATYHGNDDEETHY